MTWTLDSLGNDLSTGTYNEANEMTPTVGSSGYDDAGNMTTLQSGDTAVYDAWNRLVEVNDGEDIIQQNEYDGTNRRIQIFTDFTGTTPATTQDDYHRNQQVIETRENASIKYQHIWSPRYIDALILRDTYSSGSIVTADRLFYLSDANYNVTALVKYDSGQSAWQVAERYTYTPYGTVTYRNPAWTDVGSSANNNLTLYTGRTLDPETDLMYYRARYYDPSLERFINRDPIEYEGSPWNLYEYARSSPLIFTDPLGKDVWIEKTSAAGGLHRQICVDTYDNKGKKNGKYCISFRHEIGNGIPCLVSENRQRCPYPIPGTFPYREGGTGEIYEITKGKAKVIERFPHTKAEDKRILKYFKSIVGLEGQYCAQYTCRQFSSDMAKFIPPTLPPDWPNTKTKQGILDIIIALIFFGS